MHSKLGITHESNHDCLFHLVRIIRSWFASSAVWSITWFTRAGWYKTHYMERCVICIQTQATVYSSLTLFVGSKTFKSAYFCRKSGSGICQSHVRMGSSVMSISVWFKYRDFVQFSNNSLATTRLLIQLCNDHLLMVYSVIFYKIKQTIYL